MYIYIYKYTWKQNFLESTWQSRLVQMLVLWLEAAPWVLQTFPFLGFVPLIIVLLNESGEEEEFNLLLMCSCFKIKSLPLHFVELCSQIAYQDIGEAKLVDSYVRVDMTSSFIQPVMSFYECLEASLLKSSQPATWKEMRWLLRIAVFRTGQQG